MVILNNNMFFFNKRLNELTDKLNLIENKIDILIKQRENYECNLCGEKEKEIYENLEIFISHKLDSLKLETDKDKKIIEDCKNDILDTFNNIIDTINPDLLNYHNENIYNSIYDLDKKIKNILITLLEYKISEINEEI
jgi:hypothetical protein